jgi:hypothetical protein
MCINISRTVFVGQVCWGWRLTAGTHLVASGTCATEDGARYAAEIYQGLPENWRW